MELDWLTGFALMEMCGFHRKCLGCWYAFLSPRIALVNKGAGLRLKFRVFVIVVTGIV